MPQPAQNEPASRRTDLDAMSPEQRARTLVARLELVSHGAVAKAGETTSSAGGKDRPLFPAGGIAPKDDRERDYKQISHLVLQRRLARCRTDADFSIVADIAEEALAAWKISPPPPKDSKAWREMVGRHPGSVRDVAKVWGISPTYAHQLKQQYRREHGDAEAA